MSQPEDQNPISRRDLLKLGAAVPFLALPAPASASVQPTTLPLPTGPTLEGEDHPEARGLTINKFKFIALALHNFAASNGCRFPSAAIRKDGRPLLSWRVAILPYLAEPRLYGKFRLDEPWDSPHNLPLLSEIPDVYAPVIGRDRTPHSTYYQALVGPGTLFDGEEGAKVLDSYITSPTLMVVEGARPVPWTKPEDVAYLPGQMADFGGQFADGAYACFADGSARFLCRKIASETIRALIAAGKGQTVGFEHLGPWKRHPERCFMRGAAGSVAARIPTAVNPARPAGR
jgi:hypothetical protein